MFIARLREDGLKSLVIMPDAPQVFDEDYSGDATSLIGAAAASNPAADPENPAPAANPAADPENPAPAADPENSAAAPASAAPGNDVPVQAFSGAHIDPGFFPSDAGADAAVRQPPSMQDVSEAVGSLARLAAEALAQPFATPLPGNGEALQELQSVFHGVEACPTLLPHPSAPPSRPTPLPHPSDSPL